MRRLNYTRPGRVARVSGRRLGDIGRPRSRDTRQRAKFDFDVERSWNPSGWQLPNKFTLRALDTDDNFTLTAKAKTTQIALAEGDWLRFESNKGVSEVMLITKIKTSKSGTTFFVERAIHRTKLAAWDINATIYVNK